MIQWADFELLKNGRSEKHWDQIKAFANINQFCDLTPIIPSCHRVPICRKAVTHLVVK